MIRCKNLCLALAFAGATQTGAFAAAVRTTDPLLGAFASRAITIDGSFDDWPEGRSSYFELTFPDEFAETAVALAKHPALAKCRAEVMMTHNRESLYLGLRLPAADSVVNTAKAPDSWHTGGDGIIVNARDAEGKSFSVLWWGADGTGAPRLAARRDGSPWQELGKFGGKTALRSAPGKGSTVEILLPWSVLGRTDETTPRLELVWEAAFNGVSLETLKDVPYLLLGKANMNTSLAVLTAPEKQGARGYLSRPEWWGKLHFGDAQARPGATLETARGVGISDWTAPWTTKPMTIDGKLEDWPKEWLVSAAPKPWAYGDRYRSEIGVAWDAETLYLVIRYHNNGQPMRNDETVANQMGFQGGDCAQIRLKIGEKVTNLCGWYDSKNKTPGLTADGKERKEPNLLAANAREAFAVLPDGSGYVQEIAIPFKELLPAPPAAGDTWQATFQLWWIGFDERMSVETSVNFVSPPPLQTRYELPRNADISLGLFDPQGRLVRQIVMEEPRMAGVNTEAWNGLDQWGKVIPPGDYLLKGIHHVPLKLEHVMTASNPGTPPWWTADGKGGWLSDEAAPQAVVTDGETVYVAAPNAEGGFSVMAIGPDGKKLWAARPACFRRSVGLALLGDRLYAMGSGPELVANVRGFKDGDKTAIEVAFVMCLDKRTGELAGPSVKTGRPTTFATWDYRHDVRGFWDLRLNKTFSPATYGGQHSYSYSGMCETTGALGLTAVGNRLVASLFYGNELAVLDPDKLEIVKRIPLDAPAGLHGLDAKRLLAVSGKKLVTVDIESGAVTPVITAGLSAPYGVTTDKDGNIYVSDWGDSFQVKKFSPAGKPLLAIGKPGGRPWVGKWEAEGMLVPRGIAVTTAGKLWVAEDDMSPRRISVWDSGSGALIRDYIGPANYHGWMLTIDPRDPERIVTCGTEFKLDFGKKSYTPVGTVFLRRGRDDVFTPDGNEWGVGDQIRYRDGKEFYARIATSGIMILQRRGDEYRPVAAVKGLHPPLTIDGTQAQFPDYNLNYHMLPGWYPEFFKGKVGKNLLWNDLNGDGIVQDNECDWDDGKKGFFGNSWGMALGPDWEFYVVARNTVYRLDPEFGADGLPRYSWSRCRPVVENIAGGRFDVPSLFVSAGGRLYVTVSAIRGNTPEKAMICYDRDNGKELWCVGSPPDNGPKAVWGYPRFDVSYPGMGRGVITWVYWHTQRMYLLGEDGLAIAGFLDSRAEPGPTRVWLEGETSMFATQAPDGRLFLVNGNYSAHHFLEVKGLETAQRFQQPLTITQADADAAGRALAAPVPKEKEQPVILARRAPAPAAEKGIAGWELERDGVELATIRQPGRGGRIALRVDGQDLLVAARIKDETPMVNNGDNWPQAFMTGDCLDVMLATDPKADPKRRAAVAGDLRLLFTELRGKPLTVLYRPVAPAGGNRMRMMATVIDDVVELPAGCAPVITREKDAYVLTARVPLAALGLESLPGELRGDVGVIYGDATGRNRDQRLYYYNKETWMVSDLTTEASLNPDKWGRLLVELPGNLIKNPGFEEELAGDPSQGWVVSDSRNGAAAGLTEDGVFAGRRALLLEQQTALKPPADADKIRDGGEYAEKLNDGKGGGHVVVLQRFPVVAGQKYDLRFALRTEGMVGALSGKGFNSSVLKIEVLFFDAAGKLVGGTRPCITSASIDPQNDNVWKVVNHGAEGAVEGLPHTAPAGAVFGDIHLRFMVHAAAAQPKMWIDQFEFAPAQEKK